MRSFGASTVDEVSAGEFDVAILLFDTCRVQVYSDRATCRSISAIIRSVAPDLTSKKISGLGKAARYGAYPDGTVLVVQTKADALIGMTVPPGRVPAAGSLAKVVKGPQHALTCRTRGLGYYDS